MQSEKGKDPQKKGYVEKYNKYTKPVAPSGNTNKQPNMEIDVMDPNQD